MQIKQLCLVIHGITGRKNSNVKKCKRGYAATYYSCHIYIIHLTFILLINTTIEGFQCKRDSFAITTTSFCMFLFHRTLRGCAFNRNFTAHEVILSYYRIAYFHAAHARVTALTVNVVDLLSWGTETFSQEVGLYRVNLL